MTVIAPESRHWLDEPEQTWIHKLFVRTLKCGPIPQHIAAIMDGNRRYAKGSKISTVEAHDRGFHKMIQIAMWCRDFGIKDFTVYAFSIENFNRSQEEVDMLMQLARRVLQKCLDDKELLRRRGLRIQVFGNLSLLPADIQQLCCEVILMSEDYKENVDYKVNVNLCVAYTSREEITTIVQEMADGVHGGLIEPDDITEDLFDRCMYTYPSPPPDLLIRTSGEQRLSDFLLWQTSFTILSFVGILWPDISVYSLFSAILFYQHHYPAQQATIRAKEKAFKVDVPDKDCIDRQNNFFEDLQRRRMKKIKENV